MRVPHRFPSAKAAALVLLLLGAAAAAPARSSVVCTANVVHPIQVHVTALDPVTRGATVRLLVRATSAMGLESVQARLVSTGGATGLGPATVALGALAPGRVAEAVFTVGVPATGGRQYVQFAITGLGPQGRLTRGACYNLLPDGPLQASRVVVTPQGERVTEVAAQKVAP